MAEARRVRTSWTKLRFPLSFGEASGSDDLQSPGRVSSSPVTRHHPAMSHDDSSHEPPAFRAATYRKGPGKADVSSSANGLSSVSLVKEWWLSGYEMEYYIKIRWFK